MAEPIQENTNAGIKEAPGLESELDNALNKSFASNMEKNDAPIKEKELIENEKPIEEKANVEEPKQEVKAKQEKQVEVEKTVLNPDEVEKLDRNEKGAWGAIKNSNKKAHAMVKERDSQIEKLKSALAEKGSVSTKEVETLKAEIEDLRKYRAMVEIEADPEFISKYDKPIKDLESDIKAFLKQRNVSDESLSKMNINDTKTMSQLIGIIDQQEGELSASELRGKIREFLDLSQKKIKTINEQKTNYKETLEKKKQENFSKGAEAEGRMIKHLEIKASEKDKDGKPLIPFLNKIESREGASPGEVQQVENHNNMVDALNKKLQGVLKMKEPEHQAEIAIAAVASHYLMAQNKALMAELKKYKDEVQKISSVTTETPTRKPNNPTGVNGRNGELPDLDTALSSFLAKAR